MLLMIHPQGDALAIRRGERDIAIQAYRDGYRALSERSNAILAAAAQGERT